ncbi:MAG: cation:proton antiporter [Sphaerochaetaceae bacterium]|nr:cation:proton antiporter [Sphaerochaetaceae bacterium]
MLFSFAIIIILGLLSKVIFSKIKLPYIIGMLFIGILLGPYVFNILDPAINEISADLREIALIIILMKAGLSLDIKDLKKVGRPAILLCFLPASFEIMGYLLIAPNLLGITLLEAGIIGSVMAAVSPAVVVPAMTKLIEEKRGTNKAIPQMMLAGSSADDVYCIVIFTALVALEKGGDVHASALFNVPISMLTGVILGGVSGELLVRFFKKFHMRDTVKVLLLLSISFLFISIENALKEVVPVSGLLSIISLGLIIKAHYPILSDRLTPKFSKLWVGAEILLFVLVGALVNVEYATHAGFAMIIMIFIGLAFRTVGTFLATLKTGLTLKEQTFCLFSELPKATVQAAMGGVPLAMGLACGNLVLTFAVLAILITAPLGSFLISFSSKRFLLKE